MFQIKKLSFQYALSTVPALRNVTLEIPEESFTLVAGLSGSGKTTLLRHLKKELFPQGKREGEIFYRGSSIEDLKPENSVSEIAYLFQNPAHQIVMDTVWHEIAFGLENMGMPYEQMKRNVAEIVNYFDLQDIYDCDIQKLSGGQQQMVNLAALMAMHPKVLILDEPAAQLDPIGRKNFLSMIEKLQKEFQITVVMAAHNLEDVMEMADQCVFMKHGEIQTVGTVKETISYFYQQEDVIKETFPQAIRLSETFGMKPIFSMGEIRNVISNCSYELVSQKRDSGQTVLKVSHLYADYGKKKVLDNLSLCLKKQEMFAVVGANGSGKTTFLKCLAGQMQYDGKIKCRKKMVYLPQDPTVLFVKDRLEDDLQEAGNGQEAWMESLIDLCDLREKLDSHPYDLSGGQQQMAALIKVLLAKPDILLLDEPTKGLDRIHSRKFGKVLRKLLKDGLSVLFVSHDLEFAAEFADRTGMMFDGRIEGIDVPEMFFVKNYFYTTTSAKITRDMEQPIILPEKVRCL